MAQVTHKGNPIHTNGELPAVGAKAPDFKLTAGDLKDVSLADYKGKRKILNIVPSLDTAGVPDLDAEVQREGRSAREHGRAGRLRGPAVRGEAVLHDGGAPERGAALAHARQELRAGLRSPLQDGPLAGLTARAVVVLDEKDKVVYRQLVPEIGQEPDYDAALAAVK